MSVTNNSVDRALALLRLLAEAGAPLRFSDLQAQSGVPKGTLHSLLASLEAADFVRRTVAGYEIGVGAFEVGTAVRATASLREAVSPLLDELFSIHGETSHFGMLDAGDVVYLDRRDSQHALRYISRIGARKPAYATALGKAMLSLLSDSEVCETYPEKLPALTAATLPTRDALLALLVKARSAGFATESEESTLGVRCIGVAGRTGGVTYGVSITVPVQRATADQLQDYLPALHDTITRLHSALNTSEWFAPGSLAQAGPGAQLG